MAWWTLLVLFFLCLLCNIFRTRLFHTKTDLLLFFFLPDNINVNATLKNKLDIYLKNGGKLFLTGTSGLAANGEGFLFNIGASWDGESNFQPDYILPCNDLCPEFIESPLVMYPPSQRIKATIGKALIDEGEFPKERMRHLTGKGGTTTAAIIKLGLAEGYFQSPSEKGIIRIAFPTKILPFYFPSLFNDLSPEPI